MVKDLLVIYLKMSYALIIVGLWIFCMAENVCFIHGSLSLLNYGSNLKSKCLILSLITIM